MRGGGAPVEHDGAHVSEQSLDEARTWEADLVVVGTNGHGGVHRLLIGS